MLRDLISISTRNRTRYQPCAALLTIDFIEVLHSKHGLELRLVYANPWNSAYEISTTQSIKQSTTIPVIFPEKWFLLVVNTTSFLCTGVPWLITFGVRALKSTMGIKNLEASILHPAKHRLFILLSYPIWKCFYFLFAHLQLSNKNVTILR
jgi:hypothetical protein